MPYVRAPSVNVIGTGSTYVNRQQVAPIEHKAHALGRFAATYIDPFGTEHAKAPYMPAASSSTPVRVLARGTVTTTSADGYGWLAWSPSYASDDLSIFATQANTGVGIVIDFTATNLNNQAFQGSPYTLSYFRIGQTDAGNSPTGQVLARMGVFAMRLQNITPAETRGGQGFMGTINDGQQSCAQLDNSSYMTLKQQGTIKDIDVNGAWNEFTILPGDTRDFEFGGNKWYRPVFSQVVNTSTPNTTGTIWNGCIPCFAYIQAPSAAQPQTYTWELVGNWDYIIGGIQASAAQPTNVSQFPTPTPPHHEGLPNLAKALFHATLGHASGAVTAASHHSTADKVKTFFDHVGHDITNPKAWIAGGMGALGLGQYSGEVGGLLDAAGSALSFMAV